MFRSPFAGTRAIAAAAAAVADHRLDGHESAWIDKIEALRDELLSQPDLTVTFVDFGAGDPEANLTAEEMARGRRVTRTVAEICLRGNLGYPWRLFLFHLIRLFKPSRCVELGTSIGFSAAFQAAALELNGKGSLSTLEGSAALAAIAQENFRRLGLERARIHMGRFQDTLERVLYDHATVDFVFVDGHHDEQATIGYFEQMLPHLSSDALLVFDDILWYEGMQRAWNRLTRYPQVRVAVDFGVVGVILLSKEKSSKERYALPFMGWSWRMKGRLRRASRRLLG
jgi:predicted O-methyltransferase YrrM